MDGLDNDIEQKGRWNDSSQKENWIDKNIDR